MDSNRQEITYSGAATPINIAFVEFHGAKLATFSVAGEPYVAMRPVAEGMGLSWGGQRDKLQSQKEKFNCTDIRTVGADGRGREMLSMPVRKLNLWLATINPNKIKDARKRAVIELYQEESAKALYDYWNKGVALKDDYEGLVTDIDPKVMAAIGGMVKGIMQKALTELVPALVHQHLADNEIGVVRGVAANDVTAMAGVTDRKGLRGLGNFVSGRLQRYHAEKGVAVKLRDYGTMASVRVFDKPTAKEWLANGGKSEIEKYVLERRGQKALRLVGGTAV